MSKLQISLATLQVCLGQELYGFLVHNEADKLLTKLNCSFNDCTYISVGRIMSSIKGLIHLSVKDGFIPHATHGSVLTLQIIDERVRMSLSQLNPFKFPLFLLQSYRRVGTVPIGGVSKQEECPSSSGLVTRSNQN